MRSCIALYVQERRISFVAVIDETVVIAMLYVHSDHRRRGVATAPIRHMESKCRTPKLFTSTNESNLSMQSLLGKLGYESSGVIHNLDEGDPELIYFKRLK